MTVAELVGLQEPRVLWAPTTAVSSLAQEAIELAALAGLVLDPWQECVLTHMLGEQRDGRWSAFEVAMVAARQNGKGGVLEARELAGLFLVRTDRLLMHTAHEFKTSADHQRRLEQLIQNTPELHRRVKPNGYKHSHGEEGIELRDGCRIKFMTRTQSGGRGFSGDFIAFDEAMFLQEKAIAALLPTLSARPNPQVVYAGSAVDQEENDDGVAFARVRERGHRGTDPRLAFFEWSAPDEHLDELTAADLADPQRWAQANPGLGIRIKPEHIAAELETMDARTFAVERLCVGDWPETVNIAEAVISLARWQSLLDVESRLVDPVCFAYDVSPDRAWSSISVAGLRPDGLAHVEVVDHRRGVGWLPDRLGELVGDHDSVEEGVYVDVRGAGASLLPALAKLGVKTRSVTAGEYAAACGLIFDTVEQERLRHVGSPELEAALKGAAKRELEGAWAWSKKNSKVTITPLVSATLALWGASQAQPRRRRWVPLGTEEPVAA